MATEYTDAELALRAIPGEQELLPFDPSPLEKQQQGIATLLRNMGIDNYRAQQLAGNTTFLSEFIPGFGDVQGFREGKYIFDEGSPFLGAGIMGLSALPFIPVSRMVKNLRNKGELNVTPTQAFRTRTGEQPLEQASDATYSPSYSTQTGQLDMSLQEAAVVGRPNVETLLEREVIKFASDTASDLNKTYPVQNILKEMESKLPDAAKGGFKRQVDEFVPPELMKTKATLQEVLDNIGKNKPTIKEMEAQFNLGDVGASFGARYSQYLPNIPKSDTPARTLPEAMETAPLLNYTERSFAIDSPKYDIIPGSGRGHGEVSTGLLPEFTRESFNPNTKNRIFTTRSALYEQGGKKILVGAEGQSGLYGMGTSSRKALEEMNKVTAIDEDLLESIIFDNKIDDVAGYLDNPREIDLVNHQQGTYEQSVLPTGLPTRKQFEESLEATGSNLEKFGDKVQEMKDYVNTQAERILAAPRSPTESQYGETFEQAMNLAVDDARVRYLPQLTAMLGDIPTSSAPKFTSPPMLKDWFPMHMKTVLNEGVEKGADVVRFPINDYALAKQTGQNLAPARARGIIGEAQIEEGMDNFPDDTSKALAKDYKKRTEQGIKRIEGEYGIKLNAKVIDDENLNEFLEIEMTPELKEIFKTLVFNRGGAVRKPLMNLKY